MTILATGSVVAPALGFLIVVLLLLATFVLIRSMNKQLGKVPKSFDEPPAQRRPPPPAD